MERPHRLTFTLLLALSPATAQEHEPGPELRALLEKQNGTPGPRTQLAGFLVRALAEEVDELPPLAAAHYIPRVAASAEAARTELLRLHCTDTESDSPVDRSLEALDVALGDRYRRAFPGGAKALAEYLRRWPKCDQRVTAAAIVEVRADKPRVALCHAFARAFRPAAPHRELLALLALVESMGRAALAVTPHVALATNVHNSPKVARAAYTALAAIGPAAKRHYPRYRKLLARAFFHDTLLSEYGDCVARIEVGDKTPTPALGTCLTDDNVCVRLRAMKALVNRSLHARRDARTIAAIAIAMRDTHWERCSELEDVTMSFEGVSDDIRLAAARVLRRHARTPEELREVARLLAESGTSAEQRWARSTLR